MRSASDQVPGIPPEWRKISTTFVASPLVHGMVARFPLMPVGVPIVGAAIAPLSIDPAGEPPAGKTYALGSPRPSFVGRDRARTQSRVFAGIPCWRAVVDATIISFRFPTRCHPG